MTQPAKAQEPSMEEILASIRRIIADDDSNKPAQRAPDPPKAEPPPVAPPPSIFAAPQAPAPPPPPPRVEPEPRPVVIEQPNPLAESADILDLTESMASAPPPPPEPSAPPPQFRTIDGRSDVSFDDAGERDPAPEERRLISNATSAAVDSAFNSLAQTVLMQNARTLEDLVREMLRPMLKTWLDDNLPGMVERLVRAEIERVSRGRPS
jgi:cell pole-organizing protein PopZ